MGILTSEELECTLFNKILACIYNKHRLLAHDYFAGARSFFNGNWEEFCNFLDELEDKGYIKVEEPGFAITFGKNDKEWRNRLENLFPDQPQQIANQTFNISHANQVQAAGRDINSFNNDDAEKLIEILKQVIPQNPEPNSLSQKVRSWLDCGGSALDILKRIASLM